MKLKRNFWMVLVVGLIVLSLIVVPGLWLQSAPSQAASNDGGWSELSFGSPAKEKPAKADVLKLKEKKPPFAVDFQAMKARAEAIKAGDNYIKGERIVVSEAGLTERELDTAIAKAKPTQVRAVTAYGEKGQEKLVKLLKFANEGEAIKAAAALKKDPSVLYVYRNFTVSLPEPLKKEFKPEAPKPGEPKIEALTADPFRGYQWYLDKIKETQTLVPTVSAAHWVAVIDTGVDYTHEDLAGQVQLGYDYVGDDPDPMDENGHGTAVSGVIAAKINNWRGIAGISPRSQIYAIRVLNEYGWGEWIWVLEGIAKACTVSQVMILNLSLGGYVECPSAEYDAINDVISDVVGKGKIVVAAATNDSNLLTYWLDDLTTPYYDWVPVPAACPNAFTAAGTEQYDHRNFFSNYGTSTLGYVDVAAPSWMILTLGLDDSYWYWGGTSFSAPIVAASAARVWTAPEQTNTWVQTKLTTTGRALAAGAGFPVTTPRVDIFKALGGTAVGIQGQVINAATGLPISGATISVAPSRIYSNLSGFYTLTGLTAGTKTVAVRKAGFVSLTKTAVVVAGAITDDVNFYLAPVTAANLRTVVVEWESMDPGIYEWFAWLFGFEHPDLPQVEWSAGRKLNHYFGINPTGTTTWTWVNLWNTYNAIPYAELVYESWYEWRPCETLVYRPTSGYNFAAGNGMSIYDWAGGGIVGSKAETRVYKGTILTNTILSAVATDTADFWWRNFTQVGTGAVTVTNTRLPLLGYTSVVGSTVLLVGDDDGWGYDSDYYGPALDDVGILYSSWNTYLAGPPSFGDLNKFTRVVWETGNCSAHNLDRYERNSLQGFLSAGKKLFISGQDIGFNLIDNFATPASTSWYSTWLRANYLMDDTGSYGLIGVNTDLISDPEGAPVGNEIAFAIWDGDGADNQYWPSGITPRTGASAVFYYLDDDGNILEEDGVPVAGAIRGTRTVAGVTYKLVYFSFGFEAIADAGLRALVMEKVIAWLTP